jgi:hypothetical protein
MQSTLSLTLRSAIPKVAEDTNRFFSAALFSAPPSPKSAIEPEVVFLHDCLTMALFGSDRPVMPSFRISPELDSSAPSPYDDLNRLERNPDRNLDRNLERQSDRGGDRNSDRSQDLRGQDRSERNADRNLERNSDRSSDRTQERNLDRNDRGADRNQDRILDRAPEPAVAAEAKTASQAPRHASERTHPLIAGLFEKLPEPETEWSLQSRQKWLQTAANIFDLMYTPNEADAGEVTIRVERTAAAR